MHIGSDWCRANRYSTWDCQTVIPMCFALITKYAESLRLIQGLCSLRCKTYLSFFDMKPTQQQGQLLGTRVRGRDFFVTVVIKLIIIKIWIIKEFIPLCLFKFINGITLIVALRASQGQVPWVCSVESQEANPVHTVCVSAGVHHGCGQGGHKDQGLPQKDESILRIVECGRPWDGAPRVRVWGSSHVSHAAVNLGHRCRWGHQDDG